MYFEMKSRSVANEPLFALAQKVPQPGSEEQRAGGGGGGGQHC